MPKRLPAKIEDWKAPWDGEDIDPERAKAFAFKALKDAESAADRAERAEQDLAEEQSAHEATKAQLTELEDKDKPEIERLRTEVERLKKQPPAAKQGKSPLEIAMEVGDENGLSTEEIRRLSKRIQGDNDRDLRKDAESFIAEFNLGKPKEASEETIEPEGGNENDGDWRREFAEAVSNRPRVSKARPGTGPKDTPSDGSFSMESIRSQMPARK